MNRDTLRQIFLTGNNARCKGYVTYFRLHVFKTNYTAYYLKETKVHIHKDIYMDIYTFFLPWETEISHLQAAASLSSSLSLSLPLSLPIGKTNLRRESFPPRFESIYCQNKQLGREGPVGKHTGPGIISQVNISAANMRRSLILRIQVDRQALFCVCVCVCVCVSTLNVGVKHASVQAYKCGCL